MALRRVLAEMPYRFANRAAAESDFCRTALKLFSATPGGFRFAKSHEWVNPTDSAGNEAVVGISQYAQQELGDVVYVELPEVGDELKKGEVFGVVESVKAASDVYAPISGNVTEVNNDLADDPQLINKEPFGAGWLMKVKYDSAEEVSALLDNKAYDTFCDGLGH